MVEVMKTMGASFKSSHVCTATLSAPNPAAGHCQPTPLPETPGHSWASLGQSLVGSLLLSPGSWCAQVSICALRESVSPVLCKFWQLYGGLMVTSSKRAYAIYKSAAGRAPAPVADPYLLRRHQTQFSLSLCGVPGPWCAQGVFEPSERLWWVWDLILDMILSLLPSFWGFSFALGCGISPQSCSSAMQPPLQH